MLRIESNVWLASIQQAVDDGYSTFVTLMGIDDDGVYVWLRLRNADGVDLAFAADASDGLDSVTGFFPQAAWYEREVAEMFGVRFRGHDTAPLLLSERSAPVMRASHLLPARQATPWPGEKEPGGVSGRRRQLPPGVQV